MRGKRSGWAGGAGDVRAQMQGQRRQASRSELESDTYLSRCSRYLSRRERPFSAPQHFLASRRGAHCRPAAAPGAARRGGSASGGAVAACRMPGRVLRPRRAGDLGSCRPEWWHLRAFLAAVKSSNPWPAQCCLCSASGWPAAAGKAPSGSRSRGAKGGPSQWGPWVAGSRQRRRRMTPAPASAPRSSSCHTCWADCGKKAGHVTEPSTSSVEVRT